MSTIEADFFRGVIEIGSERLRTLTFEHIQNCTSETPEIELKSFIERALLDHDSEYVILGFQYLDGRKQQFIVDIINNFKKEKG
jgi:hypothetical protein